MYTEGPAMSLRTSCSLLPQKEQYRTRPLWAVGVLPRVSLVISHPHPVVDARRLLYSTGSFFCKIGFLSRRSEEHTSELQSLMRISYAVFCLKKKNTHRQS